MTTSNKFDLNSLPESVNLQDPPPPLDAKEGPEVVMRAINAWFDYQDCLKSTKQPPHPTSFDAIDGNYLLTPTRGLPLEEQPADKT